MRLSSILFLFCLLTGSYLYSDDIIEISSASFSWHETGIPNPPGGWEGATASLFDGRLYVVGGSEASAGPLRWIDPKASAPTWETASPEALANLSLPGLSPTPDGLLIVGGKVEDNWTAQVYHWNDDEGLTRLPTLPAPVSYPSIRAFDNGTHIAGFDPQGKLVVWRLRADGMTVPVIAPTPLPGNLAAGSVSLMRQQDGDGHELWVIGENWIAKIDSEASAASFSLSPMPIHAAAVPVGVAHLLIPTRTDGHYYYHTVTKTWIEAGVTNDEGTWRLFERSGETVFAVTSTGNETIIWEGAEAKPAPRLSPIDFGVLIGYFVVLLAIGNWFRIREKNTRDYFLGGNRVPGWAAGISIVLTNISAVSLLSIPAKSYATNWTFFLMLLTPLIAAPLVIKFVLPFFFRLRLTTAFEYLELRFNVWLRCLGSLQYGLYEICRMGVLILLPSIVLSVVTGIDISICIIVIGVISTLYTLFGGLEAVVWTDVMQGTIMVGGILVAIGIMLFRMDGGLGEIASMAWSQEKFAMLDWSPNIAKVTVWTFLLALPIVLNGYVAHQPTVQRFMCARDIKDAGRALWTTGISAPLILGTLFLCGTMLFLFYNEFPERLNPTMEQPDQLFAWFIIQELPVGMIGLLIAAIFAATMSSLDSGLNSLSSVFVTDFYRRFSPRATDKKALLVAKICTGLLGVIGTGFGLWLATMNVLSLFDAFIEFASLLTGGLAGCFLLGIFTRRANGAGAMTGWIVSTLLVYLAKTEGNFQFYLYATIGTVSCFVVGYLVSRIVPSRKQDLTNLTLWTQSPSHEESKDQEAQHYVSSS